MDSYLKGTTTVGIVSEGSVILASDRRASAGNLISNKNVDKIFDINKRMAVSVAGSVADAQNLVDILRAETRLYETRVGEMSVKALAKLLANILHAYKWFPYYVQFLIGGIDTKGAHIYSLDPIGSMIEDKFAATGSGSPVSYGVLESYYSDDMSFEEGMKLALRAIKASMARDAFTGDGINLVTITEKEGYRRYTKEEIEKILDSI